MRKLFVLVVFGSLAAVVITPSASAQVPAPPDQVTDLLNQGLTTVTPHLVDAADAAQPGVNAVGFALRPVCVQQATVSLAMGLAGLPIKPWTVTRPFSALCAGALRAGPADPVFTAVDDAVGRQAQEAATPILEAANPVVKQIRPNLTVPCIGLSLVNPALPPPAHRFSVTNEVCWR